jgi:hypothetical protein
MGARPPRLAPTTGPAPSTPPPPPPAAVGLRKLGPWKDHPGCSPKRAHAGAPHRFRPIPAVAARPAGRVPRCVTAAGVTARSPASLGSIRTGCAGGALTRQPVGGSSSTPPGYGADRRRPTGRTRTPPDELPRVPAREGAPPRLPDAEPAEPVATARRDPRHPAQVPPHGSILTGMSDNEPPREATRAEIVGAITERVQALGWRVRDDDVHLVILLPPLARSDLSRNRWPHEPEEGPEEHDRPGR